MASAGGSKGPAAGITEGVALEDAPVRLVDLAGPQSLATNLQM